MTRLLIALGLVLLLAIPAMAIDFYSIDKTDLTTTSVNLDFGFPAKIIIITADGANGADLCIDWTGGPAVCPATDTAGDDRLAAGESLVLDNYRAENISVISASGTITINVRAWR